MNLDQYKWYKRKYYIKINCAIIMAILLVVLLLMGFPLISNAEGDGGSITPSVSPSPSPTPVIPVPDGYTSFGSLFNVGESNIYTMENTNCSDLPTGYINPCSWNDGSFGSNMFDGDLSNGEIIVPNSVLTANIGGVRWSEQAQDFVSSTFDISDFPFYYISRNTQYDTFDIYLSQNLPFEWSMSDSGLIGYRQIDGSSTDYNSYDLGDVYLICTAFYDNDPNVYVMDLAQPQNVRYPVLDHLGHLRNANTGEWDFNVYWGNYGLNTLFASNNGSIWTINPSERNGGTTLFYYSDENNNYIQSDIIGPPHIQIVHGSSSDPTYPDGSGGDIENNLYIKDCLWSFNIPQYPNSLISNGKAIFSGSLNDFQKDHLSDFEIRYTFNIYFTATRDWSDTGFGGGGHGFSDNDSSQVLGSSLLSSSKSKTFTFSYQDPNNHSIKYYNQSFEQFLNANETCTFFTKDYLYSNCMGVGEDSCTFQQFINRMNNQNSFSEMSNIKIILECTARLFYNKGGSMVPDNAFTSWYDLYSGNSGTSNNSLDNNDNPYNNNDDNSPDTTTTKKDGINITINNDPTFNNNNNNTFNPINSIIPDGDAGTDEHGDNLLTWIVKKLFGYIDSLVGGAFDSSGLNDTNNNGELSQNSLITGDSLGTSNNGFLAFMNSTFTFIPQGMWNVLQYFFTVSIVILIIAFLIRIILDIL